LVLVDIGELALGTMDIGQDTGIVIMVFTMCMVGSVIMVSTDIMGTIGVADIMEVAIMVVTMVVDMAAATVVMEDIDNGRPY
jgi:hypothetical protein